ncbi:MAG: hypothetical protein GTO55_07640, partial [Armatimonadetes bacterium]|nr:hypothetical protein [Armatimonadota bacterium]NIN66005.1 hypothetical protein [Anaerolineae bacterium]
PLVVLLVWQSLLGQSGDAPAEQSGVTGFVPLGEVGADALGSAFSSLMATLLGLSPQGVGQSSAPMLVPQDQSGDCTVAIGLASFFIGRSGLFIFATLAGNFDKTRMTAADIAVTMAVFSLIVGVFAILGGIAGLTATVFAALLGFVSVYYSLLALRGFPSAAFLGRISTALALGGIFISMIGLTAC